MAGTPTPAKSCKTCEHLFVKPGAGGRIVIRASHAYQCTVEVPEPCLPDSMKRYMSYTWPMPRSFVLSTDGAQCPFWKQRVKEKAK